jgi:hypothetical protein
MGRLCSVCQRPDAVEIDGKLARKEISARALAHSLGIHVRVMQHHAQRHLKRAVKDAAGRRRRRQGDSLLDSLRPLVDRALAILEAAEASRSHSLALQAIREVRSTLELVGRTTGELSPPGQTTINLALGVSVERAREAVRIMDEAETLTDAQIVDRAVVVIEAWNASNPNDMRIVGRAPLRLSAGDGPASAGG